MVRGHQDRPRQGVRRWWFVVASAALCLGTQAGAAEVETRDFTVYVDSKKAGDVHMTISQQDDGVTAVSCDTDVRVGAIITLYRYSYRGREQWKDGALQRFESKSNDNGKQYTVTAAAAADGLHVRVNNVEHTAPADACLTSYWLQPDAKLADQTIPILDADTGRDLQAKVQFVGPEKYGAEGQAVQHIRLSGKGVAVDFLYDDAKRLVREEWVEDGHRTVVDLSRVRR
jgi:hypothetical protein